MEISITGKHVDVPQDLKAHMEERLLRLDDKYKLKIVEAHVVLKQEKYIYVAELKVHVKGADLFAEETGDENFFEAFDKVFHVMETQLQRRKEKIKGHHGRQKVTKIADALVEEENE